MASKRFRNPSIPFAIVGVLGALSLAACASGPRRYPLKEPLWQDDDQHLFAPTPETYESPFAWDGANQIAFRPLARFFAVDPAGHATDVNAFDEVPDSSWFQNRIGRRPMSVEQVVAGSCTQKKLDPNMPDGSWIIDMGKDNGANPGFRVNVPGYGKWMMKADPDGEPERATGATSIVSRMYNAAGFWSACDTVVYFRPSILKLKDGLTITDNSGKTTPFDEKALYKTLKIASHRGDLVRMAASEWLPGKTVGPYTYEGTWDEDPNDVVPHEDRRELRGARLLAAWTNHFDTREQNTMNVFLPITTEKPKDPLAPEVKKDNSPEGLAKAKAAKKKADAVPGYVRHYIIDMGDAFGSVWVQRGLSERLGFAYYLDIPYVSEDFVTFGAIERPWEKAKRDGGIFNFYSARNFDPELWRGGYPNPAFVRMTEGDGAWMARILARFDDTMVDALAKVGDYTDVKSTVYLRDTLILRRDAILRRYLTTLSPLADVALVQNERLCAVDLARKTKVASEDRFRYDARLYNAPSFNPLWSLHTSLDEKTSQVCVELAHQDIPDQIPDDAEDRYVIVDVQNGLVHAPLRVHLYDLGKRRGFRIVGIERPDGTGTP